MKIVKFRVGDKNFEKLQRAKSKAKVNLWIQKTIKSPVVKNSNATKHL